MNPGRWYIAGPMTGLPDLNFPAFHERAAELRAEGFHVENPAEINANSTAPWAECMKADIPRLLTCDSVLLLPGWERGHMRSNSRISWGISAVWTVLSPKHSLRRSWMHAASTSPKTGANEWKSVRIASKAALRVKT